MAVCCQPDYVECITKVSAWSCSYHLCLWMIITFSCQTTDVNSVLGVRGFSGVVGLYKFTFYSMVFTLVNGSSVHRPVTHLSSNHP